MMMLLKVASLILAFLTYNSATLDHLAKIINDVHHYVPHHVNEEVLIAKPILPPLLPLPKISPHFVKDFVHHKLTDHHLHKKVVLPIPILLPPPFAKIPLAKPIISPKPIIAPILKPLPKLPLPPPKFLKPLPIPIPVPIPFEHHEPLVVVETPIVKPIIPITKNHHDVHVSEYINY